MAEEKMGDSAVRIKTVPYLGSPRGGIFLISYACREETLTDLLNYKEKKE